MKKRLNAFKSFLYFNRFERKGILILVTLLVLVMWIRIDLVDRLAIHYDPVDVSLVQAFLDSLPAQEPEEETPVESRLFAFDPNTATPEDLRQLGFSDKLAQTMINYRKKGGQFRRPTDLQRIYGMPPDLYARLEAHIRIATPTLVARAKPTAAIPSGYPTAIDPNTAAYTDLLQLGFSERVTKTLLAFRKKGGQFYQPEDLLKVYGLEPALLDQVRDYLIFPEQELRSSPEAVKKTFSKEEVPVFVDINQSTATDWQALRGIGPGFSKRILNFREKLGGFASVDQVAETWGLPDSTFQQIRPYLQLSPVYRPLPINTADIETLSQHPYISRKMAQLIVRFRENHGAYTSLEALLQLPVIDATQLEQLAPYLSL